MDRQFYWIAEQTAAPTLPPTSHALADPNGLLAAGGDLSIDTLVATYRQGVFPWYSEGQPILWWSPSPRCILFLDDLIVSRSLKKSIRNRGYRITMDQAFPQVIEACGAPRAQQDGTWILPEMRDAFTALHRAGYAHSVETWCDNELVGGLYGVSIGRMFFGESMFSRATDASKVALTYLVHQLIEWDYQFIDCQVETEHLMSMGACSVDRKVFEAELKTVINLPSLQQKWQLTLTEADLLSML